MQIMMTSSELLASRCIICQETGGSDLRNNPGEEYLLKLKDFALKRALYGETKYSTFCDRILSLSNDEYLLSSYHSSCYKDIVHTAKLQRAEIRYNENMSTSKSVHPPKRGRPSSMKEADAEEGSSHSRRSVERTRPVSCVFQCKHPESGELHRVMTESTGEKLMLVKQHTTDANVKIALATVNEPLDCVAQDMFYHKKCFRDQERRVMASQSNKNPSVPFSTRYIADIDIINAIKCSLSSGSVITLNDIDKDYRTLCEEYGINIGTGNQKKYLKQLIAANIEDVEFVQSHRKNESAQVISKKLLGATIHELRENMDDEQDEIRCLSRAASIIRKELLELKDWKFTGSLKEYIAPTKAVSFFKWVLLGIKNVSVNEKHDSSILKSAELISQQILSNLKTDRQVKYKSKSDSSGKTVKKDTPMSVGLALAVHKKTRSKNLVNMLSGLQLGTNYTQT